MKLPCSKCSGAAPPRLQPPAISGSTASRTNCNPTPKTPSKSSPATSSCPQPNGRNSKPACANTSSRAAHAQRLQLIPEHTARSRAKTFWGVCRCRNIRLNWRLIGAPEYVADYVCVHELAHLRHPNHSPVFWAAVEQHTPHRAAATAWLKQHGRELFLLG